MNVRIIPATLFAFSLGFSIFSAQAAQPSKGVANIMAEVAKVGEKVITQEDVIHLIQIEKFYKSPELSETDALYIIMQDAIAHEIAHSVGVDVKPAETPMNSPFVDQFSSPTIENKTDQGSIPPQKQSFHVDHGSYAQLYIVPKMIDRKLRKYYSNSSQAHVHESARIEDALKQVRSGKSFADAAKEAGLVYKLQELENKDASLPSIPKPKNESASTAKPTITLLSILNKLTPGTIHPNIIEDSNGYSAIKLIQRNGPFYTFESIGIEKPHFENWLITKTESLPISISNDRLKTSIKQAYRGTDWVDRLQ